MTNYELNLKYKCKLLTSSYLFFLLLLIISGSFENAVLSNVFYYLAFVMPIISVTQIILEERYKKDARSSPVPDDFKYLAADLKLTKESAILFFPVIFPTVLITLSISLLSSYLLALLGVEQSTVISESFFPAVIIHALLPALLEELLFRYLGIKLLGENKKEALILSTLFFAFAHANLFTIPYALFAGAIFSLLYIITGSIIPSLFIHFINNTLSLLSIFGYAEGWLIPTLAALSLISLIFIFAMRKRYIGKIQACFNKKAEVLPKSPLVFIGVSLFLAITSLVI